MQTNFTPEQLLAVNQASVSVQLLPLLSQQVRIDAIALDGAAVRFVCCAF